MKNQKTVLIVMAVAAMVASVAQAAVLDGTYGDLAYVNTSGVGYWWEYDATQTVVNTFQFASGNKSSVEAGDIDGDGLVDFIAGGATNSWYEAVSGGGFAFKSINPSGGSNANGIAIGDMDSDGFTDVVRINTDGRVDWYENDGSDNGLGWNVKIRNSAGHSAAIGDFDGDTYGDAMHAVGSVLLWNEPVDTANGLPPKKWDSNMMASGWSTSVIKDMVIGNFDGDDDAHDLFIVRADGTVEWWENSLNDSIVSTDLVMTFGTDALSVELGDVDLDGVDELFIGRSGSGIMIYESTGDNAMNAGLDTAAGYDANDLAIYVPTEAVGPSLGLGSLDDDGRGDLLTTTSSGQMVWQESMNGPREVGDLKEVDVAPASPSSMAADISVYDFNGDGNDDLFYIKDGKIIWRKATGADDGLEYCSKIQSTAPYQAVAAGDLDSDPNGDLFTVLNGYVDWYESDGGTAYHSVAIHMTNNATCVAVGDFDHLDGRDLLVGKTAGVAWYESDGDDSYYWVDNNFLTNFSIKKLAMGDLDGDDNTDLAVVRYDDTLGRNIVSCYESITNDSDEWALHGRGGITDVNVVDVAIGDIDGDGAGELAVVNEDGGTLWYALNTASNLFVLIDGSNDNPNALAVEIVGTDEISLKTPCSPGVGTGDVDGDCDSDLLDLYLMSEQWLQTN